MRPERGVFWSFQSATDEIASRSEVRLDAKWLSANFLATARKSIRFNAISLPLKIGLGRIDVAILSEKSPLRFSFFYVTHSSLFVLFTNYRTWIYFEIYDIYVRDIDSEPKIITKNSTIIFIAHSWYLIFWTLHNILNHNIMIPPLTMRKKG